MNLNDIKLLFESTNKKNLYFFHNFGFVYIDFLKVKTIEDLITEFENSTNCCNLLVYL